MAQKSKQPTALELFKQFRPRYRVITWESCGFHKHESSEKLYFLPEEEGGLVYVRTPHYINLKTLGLKIDLVYDPTKKGGPLEQVSNSIWEAVLKGPFKGREFYADPDLEQLETAVATMINDPRSDPQVAIKFSHSSDPITGLYLRTDMFVKVSGLKFFIPQRSKEWAAFMRAVQLERAEADAQDRAQAQRPSVSTLRGQLDEALAAIPA